MDGHIQRKTQDMLCFCLLVLLGEIYGGRALSFSGLPGTANVTENSPAGTVVYTFSVDLTPNVSVASGYPKIINSNPLTQAFAVNPESPILYQVVTTGDPVPDYEAMPHRFELQILAYDTAGANDLQILTIQVLDIPEPPMFLGNLEYQTVMIYQFEGTASGNIYQINVTTPVKNPDREIQYSLTPASLLFSVSGTGTISSLKVFDYEKDPHSYMLNITATDYLGRNTSGTLIVTIINKNDEQPYFTMKQRAFNVLEESLPGHVVANVTAKDPDDEAGVSSLRFSINNPGVFPYFSIDAVTGTLLVARRIDRDWDPLREHPNITLIIRIDDRPSGGQYAETEIVVTIEDINDKPPESDNYNYRIEIKETARPGEILLDLKDFFHDYDAELRNQLLNFTGLSGVGSSKFTQDPPDSGRIKLTGNVDLENATDGAEKEEYTLTAEVQNIAFPYYANIIYIYVKIQPVNEFKPVFSDTSYVFNVSEIAAVRTIIGQVIATDKDVPSTGISYSISVGKGNPNFSEIFWIDPTGGNLAIIARLDYETWQSAILTVQASDNNGETATVPVTVNVLEANDEPPICSPNSYLLNIPVDQSFGTNIAGFSITCVDRDSSPTSFRYSFDSGNVNNHFVFSPNAGSNVSRLILASPFDFESGLDKIWNYRLKVFITDDNLLSAEDRAAVRTETGTVTLTINIIPKPTTEAPTTPRVIILTSRENVYSALAWYVPFIISLGSLILLGLLAYLTFWLAKYIRTHCPPKPRAPKPRADKQPLMKTPEKKKAKKEVVWEMTNINAVFDGEAKDPVTGKWYEYNSKSGARRWKDTNMPSKLEAKGPAAEVMTTHRVQQDRSKQETEPSGPKLGGQNKTAQKSTERKTETSDPNSKLKLQKPKEEPLAKGSLSPAPPHKSPVPSPKIYPKYENQSIQK
ncbi:cadherin-related family member 3 [Lacerta agilis]|uniref:cadherin-related family member 3 n=1 Tax=Lacerta agilis TaxID=80427 RepID=UPI001419570F|nr:cadherin-related family member 3 [Lacerta agilis]